MPSQTHYDSGLASVANGSTAVTVTGADLTGIVYAGDLFAVLAQPLVPPQRIATDAVGGTFSLAIGWPGAALTADPYEVRITPDSARVQERTRRVLERLGLVNNTGIGIDAIGGFADRAAHDAAAAKFAFLSLDGDGALIDTAVIFLKNSATAADWLPAIPITGIKGDAGARGWSPKFASENDGARRVMKLVGYVGGEGAEPTADVGKYVGVAGYVVAIADGVDVRGPAGANGTNGTNGTNGLDGAPGANGANGADGTDPGVLFTWDDGNTDADPGAGNIRANLDALGSAGFLYVSKTNRAGNDVGAWLLGLASSTAAIKASLVLTRSTGNAQATFDLTGLTDAAGYVKLTITAHAGATGFVAANAISLQAMKTGDDGTGAVNSVNGATGTVVLATDNISDTGQTSKWATAAEKAKLGHIAVTQSVDLDAIETSVAGLGTAATKNTGIAAGQVPVLDGGGLLDTSILPAIAITDVFTVASQAAMLALTAQRGDIAIRSDLNKSFALATNSPGTLADWKELLTPTDVVLAVAGLTGTISAAALKAALALAKADVGLGNVDNTSNATERAAAATLTNKRVTARVFSEASSATSTPNADSYDQHNVTALAAADAFAAPTGAPTDGQKLIVRIKDNGTARALSFHAIYRALGPALPTTTVLGKTLYLGFIYNAADTKWDLLAKAQEP